QRSSGFSRTSAGTQSRSIRRIRAVRRPRASCRSDRSALLAPAPETGGSWLAAGCASISRWNAKIRPTNHARSRRLGADVGARRTAPPGSTAPRQLTYGPLYALSAEPTRYVTLTVIVAFDGAGKSSTRKPLSSRYSVMPSTEVTRVTPSDGRTCAKAHDSASDSSKVPAASDEMRFIGDL